jgi:predicted DNA-binding transcriptional regulator AlpA
MTRSEHVFYHAHMKLIYRRREAAEILGFSQAQILKFEREGLLHPIRVQGLRSVRYDASEVDALAKRWIAEAREPATAGAA